MLALYAMCKSNSASLVLHRFRLSKILQDRMLTLRKLSVTQLLAYVVKNVRKDKRRYWIFSLQKNKS